MELILIKMKGTEFSDDLSPPMAFSETGDVRIGPVLSIWDLLSEFGVSPQRACLTAGVEPSLFADPESRVSLNRLGLLLETGADLTGCRHFGLLVGERFEIQKLGSLGYLMKNSATVGDALRSLILHLHLYDRGAAPLLVTFSPGKVILGYSIYQHATPAIDQVYDAVNGIIFKILRALCGPSWAPLQVNFCYRAPANTRPYKKVFSSRLSFDAGASGVVFASSWLDKPIPGADPVLYGLLLRAMQGAETVSPMSFAEQVQLSLYQLVLTSTATADAVAHLVGVKERTLRRRLAREGMSLRQLVNQTKFQLARQLLAGTDLPVAEIASILHYADPNIFSRAFSNWAKMSPSQWRNALVRQARP